MIDHLEASPTTAKTIPHRFSVFPNSPGYEVQWRDVDPEASISLVFFTHDGSIEVIFCYLHEWLNLMVNVNVVCKFTSPVDSMGNYGKRKN